MPAWCQSQAKKFVTVSKATMRGYLKSTLQVAQFLLCIRLSAPLFVPEQPSTLLSRRTFSKSGIAVVSTGVVQLPARSWAATAATSDATLEALRMPLAFEGAQRLILCRHGETEYNRLGLAQGRRIDAELNDRGYSQATALGQAIAESGLPISGVYCSSLRRSRDTAGAVIEALNEPKSLRVHPTPFIDEIDYGSAEGSAGPDAVATTLRRWCSGDLEARVGSDGESAKDVSIRVSDAVSLFRNADLGLGGESSAKGETAGGVVVAVSHSTFIRFFLHQVVRLPLAVTLALDQRNCCINVLDIAPVQAGLTESQRYSSAVSLRAINCIGHLTKEGLATRSSGKGGRFGPLQDAFAEAARAYALQKGSSVGMGS